MQVLILYSLLPLLNKALEFLVSTKGVLFLDKVGEYFTVPACFYVFNDHV